MCAAAGDGTGGGEAGAIGSGASVKVTTGSAAAGVGVTGAEVSGTIGSMALLIARIVPLIAAARPSGAFSALPQQE